MKGQNPFGKRKPKTNFFCSSLVKYKSLIYTPDSKEVHPFVECLSMWIYNEKFHSDFHDIVQNFGGDRNVVIRENQKLELCKLCNYSVHLYEQSPIKGGLEIKIYNILNPEATFKIAMLDLRTHRRGYALLIPNDSGNLPILKYKKCSICSVWLPKSFKDHISKCNKCYCGKRWYKEEGSEVHICKPKKKRGRERDISNAYQKSKEETYSLNKCFFSDIETFPNPHHHVPYSIAIATPEHKSDECAVFSGKECMDEFFEFLLNYDGTLWYFNGGRFDFYFLFRYCLKNDNNDIKIVPNSLLIRGTTLLTFTITTRVGFMVLKDMWRFTPGSLDANCRAYQVDTSLCKGSFNHNLIRTWEDVETYKELYEPYVSSDVFAMRAIFDAYSKTKWEAHHINAHEYMTASHLAYGAWSSALKKEVLDLLYKIPKADEETVRKFYRGGRVLAGRPEWVSNQYEFILKNMYQKHDSKGVLGHFVTQEVYDSIKDYVMAGDVCSLYPSAMVDRKYPIGRYKRYKITEKQQMYYIQTLYDKKDKNLKVQSKKVLSSIDFWNRSAACVNCKCPNDLMVAFLTQRNKEGIVEQNLFDKVQEWYTGPELREAIKLGYVVSHIHEIMTWDESREIFNHFIKSAYDRKSKAKSGTPIYTSNKSEMNDLSGKFAQASCDESVHIVTDLDQLDDLKIKKMTEMSDPESGETLAYLAFEEKQKLFSDYPAQLSCFILGHSKVTMSRLLRKAGLLHDEDLAMIYGDTDAYLMPVAAWEKIPEKMKTTEKLELGTIKVDVPGKIISEATLALKTYQLIYINEKTLQIMCKTRCKGIPHTGLDYPAFNKTLILSNFERMEEIEKRKGGDFTNTDFIVDIKERIYEFKHKDGKRELLNIIPGGYFNEILNKNMTLSVTFGTMKRTFDYTKLSGIYIEPDYSKRDLIMTPWWDSKRRVIIEGSKKYSTAYPPGHYKTLC